jgi:RNA polymerase sigma factor (sigma-70 family)
MGYRSLSAILLVTLAAPPAQSTKGSVPPSIPSTLLPASGPCDGAAANGPRARRRGETAPKGAFSSKTLEGVSRYLSCRAAKAAPDADAALAWDEFYPECDLAVRRFAMKFSPRGTDVEDVVQDVWTDLMQSLPDFRLENGRGRFTSWLYTVVRSRATDRLRKEARRSGKHLPAESGAEVATEESSPAEKLLQAADREDLQSALSKLRSQASAKSYRVLHLRYIEGWDVRRVAAELGISREQVWVREHRIKRKLRSLLPEAEQPSTGVRSKPARQLV